MHAFSIMTLDEVAGGVGDVTDWKICVSLPTSYDSTNKNSDAFPDFDVDWQTGICIVRPKECVFVTLYF